MERKTDLIYEADYVQSANTLFHFMKKDEYLYKALQSGNLSPRYCVEDIRYLNLEINSIAVNKVAVLQKCFCDMPLHQLTKSFYLEMTEKATISEAEQKEVSNNNHTAFYGEYAIAFSKHWGIKHGLMPVHYVNENSGYVENIKKEFHSILAEDAIPDEIADSFLNRLAYLKPLQGTMGRTVNGRTISFIKNFHDEKEWRYVPAIEALSKLKLERLIYKQYIQNDLNAINTNLETIDRYKSIGLSFTANDIRYLIVPNEEARINLIRRILELPNILFEDTEDTGLQKNVLISKILVLQEIEKDW